MCNIVKIEMQDDEITELENMSQMLGTSREAVVKKGLKLLYDSYSEGPIDQEEVERLCQLYLDQYSDADNADDAQWVGCQVDWDEVERIHEAYLNHHSPGDSVIVLTKDYSMNL